MGNDGFGRAHFKSTGKPQKWCGTKPKTGQKKESKVVALLSLDRALLAQKRSPSLNST